MRNDSRVTSSLWVFFGILIAGAMVASTLQGREPQRLDDHGETRLTAVMSGLHRTSEGPFRGAGLTAVMGECSLDLRHTDVTPGGEATVEVMALMGSVVLRVPSDWVVDTTAVPVLGDVTDERRPISIDQADTVGARRPFRLILRGTVLMGGLVIKS